MKGHQVRALARPIAAVVLGAASAAVFANNDNPGNNGAMTFANVNVVNAPVAPGASGARLLQHNSISHAQASYGYHDDRSQAEASPRPTRRRHDSAVFFGLGA